MLYDDWTRHIECLQNNLESAKRCGDAEEVRDIEDALVNARSAAKRQRDYEDTHGPYPMPGVSR